MKKITVNNKIKSSILIACILLIACYITLSTNKKATEIILNRKNNNNIYVYVKGEVKNTGQIYLNNNATVKDAIEKSGGITPKADISKVNLNKKIKEGEVIQIPIKERYIEIEDEIEDENSTKININKASKEKLMELEGIGEKTAERIIKYREDEEFFSIEDIMNVSGIGEKKYEKIKKDICI